MVLRYIDQYGSIKRADVAELCHLTPPQAYHLLKKLKNQGKIQQQGERRYAVYTRVLCILCTVYRLVCNILISGLNLLLQLLTIGTDLDFGYVGAGCHLIAQQFEPMKAITVSCEICDCPRVIAFGLALI